LWGKFQPFRNNGPFVVLVIPYAGMLLAFLIGANRVQRGLHTGQETDSRIHALTNFIATLTYIRLGRSGWLCDRFLDRDRVLSPALPAYALLLLLFFFDFLCQYPFI
jgi:hypothetical protein